MKSSHKKYLEKEAMELWQLACAKKWGEKCAICGMPANTFHHFIPKSRSTLLKYDVENGVPLCLKHHYIIHFSKNPAEIHRLVDKIRTKRGKKWCEYIDKKEKSKEGGFNTIKWLETIINNYGNK